MDRLIVCAAFLLLPLAVLLAFLADARRDRRDFGRQFPPISDEEFLARCTPGTCPEVALKVRQIVSQMLAVEYEQIDPSTRFVEDLGAD